MIIDVVDNVTLEDGDPVERPELSATSFIIVDTVMKSLTCSITASQVMGATGSSSRLPPPKGSNAF